MKSKAPPDQATDRPRMFRRETAEILLETLPTVMGYVSCELRRNSPIETPLHFRLLRVLRNGKRNLHELADIHSVRLPTMSRTISVLEKRGWISRSRSTEDRRTVFAMITDKGKCVLQEVEATAISRAAELLAEVDEENLRNLNRGMEALYEVVRNQLGIDPDEGKMPDVSAQCGGDHETS